MMLVEARLLRYLSGMRIDRFLLGKLKHAYIWRRIAMERLTEPVHLNIASVLVALFGSWRQKVAFDLILRQHNAYGLLKAADDCRQHGITRMAACEFGGGKGSGLINMAIIAEKVSRLTGVEIRVFGFDSGVGLPTRPIDYRDHPEHYTQGDHAMDVAAVKAKLPPNAELVLGEISQTVDGFLQRMEEQGWTMGYAVIDVDYYSSTVDVLKIFAGPANLYLPLLLLYFDDIGDISHHPYAGELLAITEFNEQMRVRKIVEDPFFENRRIFRRANWIKRMRILHVLDHVQRSTEKSNHVKLNNPYL